MAQTRQILDTATNLRIAQNCTTNFNIPNGTGPFKYKSFTPGSQSVFVANPDYWAGHGPYLDTITMDSTFTQLPAMANALLGGDLDIVPVLSPVLARANAASGEMVLGRADGPGFIAPTMHMSAPPFNNIEVRQALRYAIDRAQILTNVYEGFGALSNDLPGQTDKYFTLPPRPYDPDKAKALLKSAGHENLAVTLDTSEVISGQNEMATAFSAQAAPAGIKIKVNQIDPSSYYANIGKPTPNNYPNRPFSMNNPGYADQLLDQRVHFRDPRGRHQRNRVDQQGLVYDAIGESDPTLAQEKWHAVQELEYTSGGYIIPATLNALDGYSKSVRGALTTALGPCSNYQFNDTWLAT